MAEIPVPQIDDEIVFWGARASRTLGNNLPVDNSATDLPLGSWVHLVDIKNKPEYMSQLWKVVQLNCDNGRMMLKNEHGTTTITVMPQKIRSLTIANISLSESGLPALEDMRITDELAVPRFGPQVSIDFSPFVGRIFEEYIRHIGQWLPLPLYGNNWIRLREAPRNWNGKTSFWPRLNELRLQVEFRSMSPVTDWGVIVLEPGDDLKPCPQDQWWPHCTICNRFLFPPGAHRNSRRHQRYLGWQQSYGTRLAP